MPPTSRRYPRSPLLPESVSGRLGAQRRPPGLAEGVAGGGEPNGLPPAADLAARAQGYRHLPKPSAHPSSPEHRLPSAAQRGEVARCRASRTSPPLTCGLSDCRLHLGTPSSALSPSFCPSYPAAQSGDRSGSATRPPAPPNPRRTRQGRRAPDRPRLCPRRPREAGPSGLDPRPAPARPGGRAHTHSDAGHRSPSSAWRGWGSGSAPAPRT